MKPTFLLGVGCQKGGTTWLHAYLDAHPQCDMGFKKEYHVFDALHVSEMRANFVQPLRRVQAALSGQGQLDPATLRTAGFLLDPSQYFQYFHYLLTRDPQILLTGDITPSYSGLPVAALQQIRQGFQALGVPVKVLFLMRDPVERNWSQVRMRRRNALKRQPGARFPQSEEADLLQSFASPQMTFRTRYDQTVQRLEAVFPAQDIHLELYERLFTDQALGGICDFLGVELAPADFGVRHNASAKSDPLSPQTRALIAEHYRPVYDFARARFGPELDALWSGPEGGRRLSA